MYHVLKALPEKAYQYFKQKVRSATDKPKDEQDARKAFFLALRNFAMSNKLNVGTDENNTQMVAQSAAMENPICAFCGKGSHPTEACYR
jgi:thiamine pyrophosphokinase